MMLLKSRSGNYLSPLFILDVGFNKLTSLAHRSVPPCILPTIRLGIYKKLIERAQAPDDARCDDVSAVHIFKLLYIYIYTWTPRRCRVCNDKTWLARLNFATRPIRATGYFFFLFLFFYIFTERFMYSYFTPAFFFFFFQFIHTLFWLYIFIMYISPGILLLQQDIYTYLYISYIAGVKIIFWVWIINVIYIKIYTSQRISEYLNYILSVYIYRFQLMLDGDVISVCCLCNLSEYSDKYNCFV